MTTQARTFTDDFRKFFFRGLAIVLPSLVTLMLLYWAGSFLWQKVANPINKGVRGLVLVVAPEVIPATSMPSWYEVTPAELAQAMLTYRPKPVNEDAARHIIRMDQLRAWWEARWYLQAIGFIVAIIIIYLAGVVVGNLIGRRIYARIESIAVRVPVIKQIYPSVKQVTDFVLGQGDQKSKLPAGRVVAIEYPRKGIWTLGLMTREAAIAVNLRAGAPCVAVFVPTTPTPFTGFTVHLPATDVFEVPWTIDELIKFVVSAGVLIPESQVTGLTPVIDSGQVPAGWRATAPRGTDGVPRPDAALGRAPDSPAKSDVP